MADRGAGASRSAARSPGNDSNDSNDAIDPDSSGSISKLTDNREGMGSMKKYYFAAPIATALALIASHAHAQTYTVGSADCAITYTVSKTWNGGFNADIVATNRRSTAINGWVSTWSFAGGEKIGSSWRSGVVSAGPGAELRGLDYNRVVPAGGTVDFGFTASGTPSRPKGFKLNGLSCESGAPPPPPPPPPPPAAGGSYGTLVLNENFSNRNSTTWQRYTLDMVRADFGAIGGRAPRGFDGGGDTWDADNRVRGGILRANYPPNIAGGYNTGFIFDKFFTQATEATFEYRVRFEGTGASNRFEWAYGGKLPGLGGTTIGQSPTGCTTDANAINNGFSARLMWRRDGRLVVYTYLPDRDTTKCGVDYTFLDAAQPNRWYTIRQHIRLNTPGQRNGLLEMFVDGQRTLQMTDVFYRKSGKDAIKINNVLFHTYRGGADTDKRFWSPNDDHIQFDDFKVWVK
jgi:Cellulose binding domain